MTHNNDRRQFRLLRLPEVLDRVGLGKTSIYALERQGAFPSRVRLSARAVAWSEEAIEEFLASRPRARQGGSTRTHDNAPAVAAEASISAQ